MELPLVRRAALWNGGFPSSQQAVKCKRYKLYKLYKLYLELLNSKCHYLLEKSDLSTQVIWVSGASWGFFLWPRATEVDTCLEEVDEESKNCIWTISSLFYAYICVTKTNLSEETVDKMFSSRHFNHTIGFWNFILFYHLPLIW